MAEYLSKGARLSACGRYRYLLWREWRGTHDRKHWEWLGFKDGAGAEVGHPKPCLFVMLNPSTADGEVDDPTIRRCVAFAKAWRYERLEVVNLFAYRATAPEDLFAAGDAMHGYENQEIVERAARDAGLIVCAWGAHGDHGQQDEIVRGWMEGRRHYALGFTRSGQPKHPLYLKASSALVPMP